MHSAAIILQEYLDSIKSKWLIDFASITNYFFSSNFQSGASKWLLNL
jgi:hypothetical protein